MDLLDLESPLSDHILELRKSALESFNNVKIGIVARIVNHLQLQRAVKATLI